MASDEVRESPWARSWWVDEHLMGGAYPGSLTPGEADDKVERIVAAGVTLFLDLTEEVDGLAPYEHLVQAVERNPRVRRVAVPVRDFSAPRPEQVQRALDLIDAEAAAGGVTYVHCWGGIGRTGSIVGCYLARTMGGEAALEHLALLRARSADAHRVAPETEEQRDLVRGWA